MTAKAQLTLAGKDKTAAAFRSVDARLRKLDKLAGNVSKGLGAFVGAKVITQLGSLAAKSLNAADAIEKLSRRSGGSARFLSEMRHALSQNDVSIGEFNKSLTKINKSAQDAADGLSTPSRAFQKLGIDVNQFLKLNTDQKFLVLSDAISQIEDPAIRTQTAMDIMGRSGTQLLTVMENGAAGIEAYREQSRELGLSLSEDQVKGAAAANDALDSLSSAISGGFSQVILQYTDEIKRAADITREYLPKAIEFLINTFRGLKAVMQGVVLSILETWEKLFTAAAKIPGIGKQFKEAADFFIEASDIMDIQLQGTMDAMAGVGRETQKVSVANTEAAKTSEKLAKVINTIGTNSTKAVTQTKKLVKSIKELTAPERIAKSVEDYRKEVVNTQADVEELNRLFREGLITNEEHIELIKKYPETIQKAGDEWGDVFGSEMWEKPKNSADEAEKAYKDAAAEVSIDWGRFATDVIENGGTQASKNLWENVKQQAFAAILEIAAKWAAAKIFGGDSGGVDWGALIGTAVGSSGSGGGSNTNVSGGGTYGNAVGAANSAVATYDSYQSGDYLGTATSGYATYTQAMEAYNSYLVAQGQAQGAVYGGQITSTATYGGTASSGASGVAAAEGGSAAAAQGSTTSTGGASSTAGAWASYLAGAYIAYTVIDDIQGARSPQQIARHQAADLRGGNVYTDEKESGFVQSIDYDGGGNLRELGNTRTLITGFQDRSDDIETFAGGREGFFEGVGYQGLGAMAADRGLEVTDYGSGIKIAAHSQEELNQLMDDYNAQISRAHITSDELHNLIETRSITSGQTLTNNLTRVLGGTVETSKAALVEADKLFDGYVASGTSAHDAVYASLSKTLGLSIEDTEKFIEASGLSADTFARYFEAGSGEALGAIERFREGGADAMREVASSANQYSKEVVDSFESAASGAGRALSGIQFDGNVSVRRVNNYGADHLGDYNLGGSFIVPGVGSSDLPFSINLTPGEQVDITPRNKRRKSFTPFSTNAKSPQDVESNDMETLINEVSGLRDDVKQADRNNQSINDLVRKEVRKQMVNSGALRQQAPQ